MSTITAPLSSPRTELVSNGPESEKIGADITQATLCQRISGAYRRAIGNLLGFLQKHKWHVTSMVLGTLLLEPWQALKAAFMSPASWKGHFNFYGMNPTALTDERVERRPILLIHGNYHNQSAWLSFARKAKCSELGPLYTVNLPNGAVTMRDYEIIQTKIDEIKAQYKELGKEEIKIDVVGHSRGGDLAHLIAWTFPKDDGLRYWGRSESIGKVTKIGSVLNQEEISASKRADAAFGLNVFEITGTYDALEIEFSLLPSSQKLEVQSGHLGLLYSSRVHQQIIQSLQS